MTQPQRDEKKVEDLIRQKLQISTQIRELQNDITKLNLDLLKVGATSNELICW